MNRHWGSCRNWRWRERRIVVHCGCGEEVPLPEHEGQGRPFRESPEYAICSRCGHEYMWYPQVRERKGARNELRRA